MFLTFFTVFYVLFGSSCGFQRKEVCYGRSVDIDIYSYPFYKGPLYFYPKAGGARKLLMDNRQAMDARLKVRYSKVKLTQLTEADNGNFVITGSDGQNLNLFSLNVLDCSTKKPLFYEEEFAHNVPRQAELREFTLSQVDNNESKHTKTYVIVAVVVAVGLLLCCCWCCCKACCCGDEKAQTVQLITYNHDLNEPAGPGSTAPPYSAVLPPLEVNVGISHDAAAASTGPVSYQPTFQIKNISQPEVTPVASETSAPSSSFGYNLLSADYEPVFQMTPPTKETCAPVSAFGSNILSSDTQPSFELNRLNLSSDLPLNTEQPSTNVNKPNEFNFL
ncbi:uncharacterized protein LOC101174512 isoform X2 [Oryzias latipes]|uniref:uncharacterized protein LOC101174512 isoform X2 n=1 Tax=Oryzias latipes TaxID=8090 RepID=UPI000CE17CB9|nr:uncharacterized protein LOC101174512 isoform X2 [Oryzias latipes]